MSDIARDFDVVIREPVSAEMTAPALTEALATLPTRCALLITQISVCHQRYKKGEKVDRVREYLMLGHNPTPSFTFHIPNTTSFPVGVMSLGGEMA